MIGLRVARLVVVGFVSSTFLLTAVAAQAEKSLTQYLSEPRPLDPIPLDGASLSWYASISVSATLPGAAKGQQSKLLEPNFGRTFLDAVSQFLGVNAEKEGYTLVVQPTISGVELPPIAALKIALDNKQPTVSVTRQAYSPWVPYSAGSVISIQMTHAAQRSSDFDLFAASADFAGSVATQANWAVGVPLQGALKVLAGKLDNGFRRLAYRNVANQSVDQQFVFKPSATLPGKGQPKGYVYTLFDVKGKAIADIKIEFEFRRTLREPPLTDMRVSAPPVLSVSGASDLDDPAYRFLRYDGQLQSLDQVTADYKVLREQLANARTSDEFILACQDLLSLLARHGFNSIDVTYIATKLMIRDNRRLTEPAFNGAFLSRCMQGRAPILQGTGVIQEVPPVKDSAQLTMAGADAVAIFIRYKGITNRDVDATNALAAALNLEVEGRLVPLTREDALKQLAALPTRFAGHHCMTQSFASDGMHQQYVVSTLLRVEGGPDQLLELRADATEPRPGAASVVLRAPTIAEFNDCAEQERRRQGVPPVS